MIVPPPWEPSPPAAPPPAAGGTFAAAFWNVVHTYAGHTRESLRRLRGCGAALGRSLAAGATSHHEATRPAVPPPLLDPGAIPLAVPMEELPPVECCGDDAAIVRMRLLCFRYGDCVAELLRIVKEYSAKWGRLRGHERRHLDTALAHERESRIGEDELRECFTELVFSGKGLCQLTEDVTRFSNLTTLVLSNNEGLTSIPYLPPTCLVLMACGCSIQEVCASNSLICLGLAYNRMEGMDFLTGLPELRVLDLTRNNVFSIEATIEALQKHPVLEEVVFTGCPIALLDDYRGRITVTCARLRQLDNAPLETVGVGDTQPEEKEKSSTVVLRIEVIKLGGLSTLVHSLIEREESPSATRSESKSQKGKKKSRAVSQGPLYQCITSLSLQGSWGENDSSSGGSNAADDNGGAVVVTCDNIPLVPNALSGPHPSLHRRKSGISLMNVEDVCAINHVTTASPVPTATLSESLAKPCVLRVRIHDEILFPSGNCVTLTCDVGSFYVDASSLLVSTGPLPRSLTLEEPLLMSKAGLDEVRVKAEEFRHSATAATESLTLFTQSSIFGSFTFTSTSPRRRNNSAMPTGQGSAAEQFWAEAKRREVEVEELNLLAEIEERRVEELKRLSLMATMEFSLGSAPKVAEAELTTANRGKGARRGRSEKVKR